MLCSWCRVIIWSQNLSITPNSNLEPDSYRLGCLDSRIRHNSMYTTHIRYTYSEIIFLLILIILFEYNKSRDADGRNDACILLVRIFYIILFPPTHPQILFSGTSNYNNYTMIHIIYIYGKRTSARWLLRNA